MPRANLGQQLAAASWVAPLVAFALNGCLSGMPANERVGAALAGVAFYVVGLVCGILALATMRKYGRRRVLAPAIVGVCLNGVLVALVRGDLPPRVHEEVNRSPRGRTRGTLPVEEHDA